MAVIWILSSLYVLFVFCFGETEAGDFCYRRYNTIEYCTYGCCGSSSNQYCCDSRVGLIVGCIFAGIAAVCVIVAIVCCCIKTQGKSGRVVQPNPQPVRNGANVTVVYAGNAGAGPYPQYGMQPMGGAQPPQPPAYKPSENPPPAYTYNDPAYPPATAPSYNQPPAATGFNQPPPPGFIAGQQPSGAP